MPNRYQFIPWDRRTRLHQFEKLDSVYANGKLLMALYPNLISPFAGYISMDDDLDIGVTEIIGRRGEQEDAVAFAALNSSYAKMPTEVKRIIFEETFQNAQENLREKFHKKNKLDIFSGSTCIASAIHWNDVSKSFAITTASVGDSVALLLCVDSDAKKVISCDRINEYHNSDLERERIRVQSDNGTILNKRLGGTLAMTRALGDFVYDGHGISHMPDIIFTHCEKNKSYLFIQACDGLYEPFEDKAFITNVVDVVENKWDWKNMGSLTCHLTAAAYKAGSGDNISVMATPLNESMRQERIMTLFDGHGGNDASKLLKDSFVDAFNSMLVKHHHDGNRHQYQSQAFKDFNKMTERPEPSSPQVGFEMTHFIMNPQRFFNHHPVMAQFLDNPKKGRGMTPGVS